MHARHRQRLLDVLLDQAIVRRLHGELCPLWQLVGVLHRRFDRYRRARHVVLQQVREIEREVRRGVPWILPGRCGETGHRSGPVLGDDGPRAVHVAAVCRLRTRQHLGGRQVTHLLDVMVGDAQIVLELNGHPIDQVEDPRTGVAALLDDVSPPGVVERYCDFELLGRAPDRPRNEKGEIEFLGDIPA